VKVSDRALATPIPKNDELPFTHLMIDCIGPIFPEDDRTVPKPQYNIMHWWLLISFRVGLWPYGLSVAFVERESFLWCTIASVHAIFRDVGD
jgi:hypothetical protein